MELTVITGMSGAGKSQAMGAFEDAGWFCVDNLPPGLLPALADLFLLEGSRVERAAVVCDVRGGVWFKDLEPVLERVEEAAGAARGWSSSRPRTRRSSTASARPAAPPAVGQRDRQRGHRARASRALGRERADVVIDTTGLSIWDLRRRVADTLLAPEGRPRMHAVRVVRVQARHPS